MAEVNDPAPGMVEKRGSGLWLTHALMIFGVLVMSSFRYGWLLLPRP